MYKVNINCEVLKRNLGFLIRQGLIEERNVRTQSIVYSITRQGSTLLKGWTELKLSLSMDENDNDHGNEWQPFFRNSVTVNA
jgi:predicted transcriptional regulator